MKKINLYIAINADSPEYCHSNCPFLSAWNECRLFNEDLQRSIFDKSIHRANDCLLMGVGGEND